jgi:hypothetical protein
MPYDRLVAFGGHCEPASQIRRYTGKDATGLFDWIETNWDGMIDCIETDFAHFFKLENLRACRNDNGVTDLRTNFVAMHLFGETGNRKILPGMIERDYRRISTSLKFMIRRFNEMLDEEHVLLVRIGHAPAETILRLWNALERAHPAGKFELLIVNKLGEPQTTIEHPRIRVDVVAKPAPGPNAWLGDNASWDAVFARQAPDNKAAAPVG